jgi:hypothetical protein
MEHHRSTDNTRDKAISTEALLVAHAQADEQHFALIRETFVTVNNKLDKLNRNQMLAAGFLSALMCFMNYPQLLKIISPSSSQAQVQTQMQTRMIYARP